MKIPRVFVPLSTIPYNWFKNGNKKWELRRYSRQYTEKNIVKNRLVELRCGYSNKEKAIWGIITDFYIYKNIESIYQNINFKEITPEALNEIEAIETSKEILNITKYIDSKFIVFKILKLENPQFIEVSSEFFDIIKGGIKKSTIRRGIRNFREGTCVLYCETEAVVVNIDKIHVKILKEITCDEARNDGFNSINELRVILTKFYGKLEEDEAMTIIDFNVQFEGV